MKQTLHFANVLFCNYGLYFFVDHNIISVCILVMSNIPPPPHPSFRKTNAGNLKTTYKFLILWVYSQGTEVYIYFLIYFWSCFVLFAGNVIYVRRKPSYFLHRIPDSKPLNVILFPINTAAYSEQKTSV